MYAKINIVGRLGAKPELRYTPSGGAVTNISVAVNERWTNKATGKPVERTDWFRVVAFGKLAETIGKYCDKGQLVLVEGRPQIRNFNRQDGTKGTAFEAIAQRVVFLNRPAQVEGDAPTEASDEAPPPLGAGHDSGEAPADEAMPF